MILFHGTTRNRADSIARHGFAPFDLYAEISPIASRYGMELDQILAAFRRAGRISLSRTDDTNIYLTTGFNHAASYASRAPEVVWETLWSVFLIRHPEIDYPWNMSDEGHYWVLREMSQDSPVVLEIEVEDSALGRERDRLVKSAALWGKESDNGAEAAIHHRVRIDIRQRHELDHRIDMQLLRFMTGKTPQDLVASIKAGE